MQSSSRVNTEKIIYSIKYFILQKNIAICEKKDRNIRLCNDYYEMN